VAWTRSDDGILNTEDIVKLSVDEQLAYSQRVLLRSTSDVKHLAAHRETIRNCVALSKESSERFAQKLFDLGRFQRRALADAYRLHETNPVTRLRAARNDGQQAVVQRLTQELLAVMRADLENVHKEKLARLSDPDPRPASTAGAWPEMEAAVELVQRDIE
jgi:hypothetical protein